MQTQIRTMSSSTQNGLLFIIALCGLTLCLHSYMWTDKFMAKQKAMVLLQDIARAQTQHQQQKAPNAIIKMAEKEGEEEAQALSACRNVVWTRARFAFVTLLSKQVDPEQWYRLSAQKLGTTLQAWMPEVDRVAMIVDEGGDPRTAAAYDFRLKRSGWKVCHVHAIDGPAAVEALSSHEKNHFIQAKLYSKFHAWRLVEYEGVCFMDADVMVLGNPSALFTEHFPRMQQQKAPLGAARDRPIHSECPFGVSNMPVGSFNAGLILLKPDQRVAAQLIQSIQTIPHTHAWAEQALLNKLYPSFYELPFDLAANMISKRCEPSVWQLKSPTIVHMTVPKPWSGSMECWWWNAQELCALWELLPPSISNEHFVLASS
jgi:hypothetical protein